MPVRCAALCVVVALLGLTACEEQINVQGNLLHATDLAKIRKGFHKRSDVQNILGTPSSVATFEKETWYYIGARVKTISFFKPEFLERKVVIVKFDGTGVVESVESREAPTNRELMLVERETPTKGRELTLIQQLIGNIGRFPTPQKGSDLP